MRRIMRGAAALAIATAALAAVGTGSAHANDQTAYGCPGGAVCIYAQNADYTKGHPTDIFYSYGAHNLSGELGYHTVLNNQYGGAGATAQLCWSYNGGDCRITLAMNDHLYLDLTPVNSIVLNRP
ncbi:hypothetical protein ABZ901_07835 [Actinacidiphila alni]|uniref:hypothetical protein n=1 Tax=Actinacidiphila alni TaxID=380248 RepID=UPI0033C9966D